MLFIGLDFYGLEESGTTFQTNVADTGYIELHIENGLVDEVYADDNINFEFTTNKPTEWNFSTILDGKFDNSLEAGNISGQGYSIQSIKIQKRKIDDSKWIDVAILPYNSSFEDYSIIDNYVANDESYIYALIPITSTVLGERVLSNQVDVEFEGMFLSDKTHNYHLLYDVSVPNITHNTVSNVFELPASKYPIITTSQIDYVSFPVEATVVTEGSSYGQIDIKAEKQARENLMDFIKNRKPKVYRDDLGEIRLIMVTDKPQIVHLDGARGIAKISFNATEIGDINDSETLIECGLIESGD